MISATAACQTATFTTPTVHASWVQRLWRSVAGMPNAVRAQTSSTVPAVSAQVCSAAAIKQDEAAVSEADMDLAQRVRLVGEW